MRLVLDPINVLPVFQRADVAEKLNDRPCARRVLRCNDVERGTSLTLHHNRNLPFAAGNSLVSC